MKKNGPGGRRASWKASSQRCSRSGAKVNNTAGMSNVAVSQYAKQLNPYKLSSSLRGSHTDSLARGVSDDVDLLGIDTGDLDLGISDEDDDDMGLDNILSSIVGINDGKALIKTPSPVAKINDDLGGNDVDRVIYSRIKSHRNDEPMAPSSVMGNVTDEQQQYFDVPGKAMEKDMSDRPGSDYKPPLMQVNLGNDISRLGEKPPIQSKLDDDIVLSTVSEAEGDNDTLWSDGAATKEHKMMVQRCQEPVFSSGGFEDTTKLESMHMTGPLVQTGAKSRHSLVDSIIDDIVMSDNNTSTHSSGEELNVLLTNDAAVALASPTGRQFPTNRCAQDPAGIKCATRSMVSSKNVSERNSSLPSKITGNREADTLSTFTEPTESPVIYTYKKSNDDDSVSQITSSLAGSSAGRNFGTSHLQNVPTHFGARSSNSSRINDISWMDNGAGVGGVMNRSRMINRKGGMVIPGPYGRDRGRRSSKISLNASGDGGRNSRGGSNSGSGDAGSASSDKGHSDLDEIAYALNADCNGRNQRKRRPPPVRNNTMHFPGNTREMSEDLSTVESSKDGHEYVETNAKSANVSRLGMSGVSCGAQSVSETTAVSDSSSIGLFQSLAWKAKRFLFPTSLAVAQRKKFDRSDSMDELEDILLEEGANTLPHRKQGGICLREDDDEEEIDYFSMAMSAPNNGGAPKKSKQRDKSVWYSMTARISAFFLVLTAFTVYRMPEEMNNPVTFSNKGEFGGSDYDAVEELRDYDASVIARKKRKVVAKKKRKVEEERDQVPNFASNAHLDKQTDVTGLGKLEQRQDQLLVRDIIQLPPVFDALADVDDLIFQKGIDIPFFWHVPRSGGGTMNDVLGSCLHLTLAADAGGSEGNGQEETLKVLHFSQVSYVNVDTSTHQGIVRAKNLNLVSSGLADVVISPLLHETSSLFIPTRRGRMFTLFRHPIERAASLFYFIQESQWKQPGTRNDQFADMTIEQFYREGFAENNWMTRFLTNELTKGEITENDLNIAKEVLRKKCLVGLLEEKGETFERIHKHFGWRPKDSKGQDCFEKKLNQKWPMKHQHSKIEDGSRAWQLIHAANKFDLRLYDFAKKLFSQQGEQLFPKH